MVALAVTTVGGVIKPGDRVLDIVPDGDDLIVEARIEPRYVDRVRVGLPTRLPDSTTAETVQWCNGRKLISARSTLRWANG
ncbi:MAG: HlyD family efflux transporter periplasmic adaptor subunit [Gammaproteobacteria bacterium]